jgi:hypothetical protein
VDVLCRNCSTQQGSRQQVAAHNPHARAIHHEATHSCCWSGCTEAAGLPLSPDIRDRPTLCVAFQQLGVLEMHIFGDAKRRGALLVLAAATIKKIDATQLE